MKKSTIGFLFFIAVCVIGLITIPEMGGYTNRNAMIVARGMTVRATMEGVVSQLVPTVGTRVESGSTLTIVENNRVDQNRLTDLLGERSQIENEIQNSTQFLSTLDALQARYTRLASSYRDQYVDDLRERADVIKRQRNVAEQQYQLKTSQAKRAKNLHRDSYISQAEYDNLILEAKIADSERHVLDAELSRLQSHLHAAQNNEVLMRTDGDIDYWQQSSDSVEMQRLQGEKTLSSLKIELQKINTQVAAEEAFLAQNKQELHTAPFNGIVNAVFASAGDLVTAETPLMEVLDCSDPITIVSIPEQRAGMFFPGQFASIRLMDSDKELDGVVRHVSSGALISRDTSIAADPSMLSGSKLIVGLQEPQSLTAQDSCDATRRARVTIKIDSIGSRALQFARTLVSSSFAMASDTPD